MAVDKELLKQIRAAEQPRHFMFATGAANQLKMSRNKPSADDQKAIKEAAGGGSKVHLGRAVLEANGDAETLVFYLKTPDKMLEPKLKRAIKEHAGLSQAVEVRDLKQFKDPDAQAPKNGQQDGGQQDGQQNADPYQPQYEALAADMADNLTAIKKSHPDLAAKLEGKYQEAVQSVQGGAGYKSAVKTLLKIQELSEKALGKVTGEQKAVSRKAAYKSLRTRVAADVQQLRVLNPAAASKMDAYLMEAEALIAESLPEDKRDYKAAIKKLEKLQAFAAKGLTKVPDTTPDEVLNKAKKARNAPADYETKYRESRAIVKNLNRLFPQSTALKSYEKRLGLAAEAARVYDFEVAIPRVRRVHKDVSLFAEEYRQYEKKRESLDQVLHQLYTATQPAFAPGRLDHFREYRENQNQLAQECKFPAASAGATALEDEARMALSERQTFLEAYRETSALLNQAEGRLADEKYFALEAFFVTAGDMFETGSGSPSQAYDLITSVGAELRQALRQTDVTKDAGKRVSEVTEGESREARRFRYKLELDGARKALMVISQHDAELGKDLTERLAKVTEAQKKSLTKAEGLFAPLLVDINAAMTAVRKGMQAGDWDSPEDDSKTPPPPTLNEWSKNITDNSVLKKMKVGKKLAAGGYGAIYRLNPDQQHEDEDLPQLVVKLPLSEEAEKKQASLEDFRKEAEIYKKIGDHPNVLKCLGIRKVGDTEGLVMEAVQGTTTDKFFGDLRARAAEGELSEAEFWSTVQYTIGKTMSAIAHIHKAGLAHNDLKPQNIMVDEVTGDVKVIDVGTANLQGEVVKGVDNPRFQAPEQLKKEGSSGQTDALPVGGVAYSGVTGQDFHFGDKNAMMSSFMSDIEKAMQVYGEQRGEEADESAIGVTSEDEATRKVNRRGEDDPNGNILLRDPSKSAGRSAYTDFMNAIMHPDPTKRLSPQQALEHPFLRDPMMSEQQVRAVIQGNSKDKATPGDEPERELIAGVFKGDNSKVQVWKNNLAKLKETLKIDPAAIASDQLIAQREAITKQLETLDEDVLKLERSIDVVTGLIATARQKDTELYFSDNKNLDTAKSVLAEMSSLRPGVSRLLRRLKDQYDLLEADDLAQTVTKEEIEKRVADLQTKRDALAQEVDKVIKNPAPSLFDHMRHLERLQAQVDTVRSNAAVEKKLLLKVAERNPDVPEVKRVARRLADHHKLLAPLVDQVTKARDDATQRAVSLSDEVDNKLVPEYDSLKKAVEDESAAYQKLVRDYQAIVKTPRETPDAMIAFEKARMDFEAAEDDYQNRLSEHRQTLAALQAKTLKLQRELGTKAYAGAANPLKRLSRLYKNLNVLKAKMMV